MERLAEEGARARRDPFLARSGEAGWRWREAVMKRKAVSLAVLLTVALAACSLPAFSGAYFTHTATLDGLSVSTGSWAEPPHICCVAPCSGLTGCGVHLLILGTGFVPGARVELLHGSRAIAADGELQICPGSIACHFSLWGACGGHWDLRVTNPDGGSYTLKKGFLVLGWPCSGCGDDGGGAAPAPDALEGGVGLEGEGSAPEGQEPEGGTHPAQGGAGGSGTEEEEGGCGALPPAAREAEEEETGRGGGASAEGDALAPSASAFSGGGAGAAPAYSGCRARADVACDGG